MTPVEDLESLTYRELQARCRDAGLRATGKYEELVERLLGPDGADDRPPPSTARKSRARSDSGEAKTPRTARKSTAATPGADKAALLRAAASTPLPAGQRAAEKGAEEEHAAGDNHDHEHEEPQPRSTSRRQLSSSPSKGAMRASAGSTGSAGRGRQQQQQQQRASTAGLATPLFWLLLLTAAAAGLASLVVPYCEQHDCAELARNLPELASEAAAEGYSAARAHALMAGDMLHERWQLLLAELKGDSSGAPVGPHACEFDASAALHGIMPEGDEFKSLKAAATFILGSKGKEPADKAAVALLVCETEADCHSAVREVDMAVTDAQRCLLHLDGRHLGGDKGALQAQLADFLRAEPTGVVVLRRLDQMSPDLLPVLINALSEQGAFQQDGQPITTVGSTFLFTSLMPAEIFNHFNEEIKFKQEAKTQMVVDMAMRAADKDVAKSQANALRRRIDLVIAVGSEPEPGGALEESVEHEYAREATDVYEADMALDEQQFEAEAELEP